MYSLSLVSAALAGTFLDNCNRIGVLSLERIESALLILPPEETGIVRRNTWWPEGSNAITVYFLRGQGQTTEGPPNKYI